MSLIPICAILREKASDVKRQLQGWYSGNMETERTEISDQIAGVASLSEPVRRSLYLYVVRQPHDVSRDEAAEALGISRSLAAFHLDKLVAEGLLQTRFERLTGRTGPGAGRPSKLYRRSNRQIDVTLPPRSYELAARLFARSLAEDRSEQPTATLARVARDFGESLGREAHQLAGEDADSSHLLDAAQALLEVYGFEPQRCADNRIVLRNCPFHALAEDYRTLVCGMNVSLIQGVVSGLTVSGIEAVLDPQPGMCCVVFRRIG